MVPPLGAPATLISSPDALVLAPPHPAAMSPTTTTPWIDRMDMSLAWVSGVSTLNLTPKLR
jgi:hypothetical protein